MPVDMDYGKDVAFDVTEFVAATNAQYLAFNLRTDGTYLFSSLENNYGHPAQLHVTSIPEPNTLTLAAFGFLALLIAARRKR
jgi:hypothetical protein